MNRFPTKINSLAHIKDFFHNEINTIIDVGILTGTEELMKVFKDKKHVLIEPVSEFYQTIEENYKKSNIDYDLLKVAISNHEGVQKLKKRIHLPNLGDKYKVTASDLMFNEYHESADSSDVVDVSTITLDSVTKKYNGPFLVKIDVDGAEIQILEGMNDCGNIYVVVVECWVRRISEFISIFKNKGFQLWDIVDLCYMRGQLSQVDLVFINDNVLYHPNYIELTPRKFGFSSAEKGNYFALLEKSLFEEKGRIVDLKQISDSGNIY